MAGVLRAFAVLAVWYTDSVLAPALSRGHHIARTGDELAYMVRCVSSAPERAFDFETNGLRYADHDKYAIGFSVAYMASDDHPYAWYVPVRHHAVEVQADPGQARRAFRDALAGADALLAHNGKFDLNVARYDDWEIDSDVFIHDTLIQAYLIYERRRFKLEALAAETGATLWPDSFEMADRVDQYLKDRARARRMRWKKDLPGEPSYMTRYGHAEVPIALEGEYSCRDVAHVLLLDRVQRSDAMGIGTFYEDRRRSLYVNEMWLSRALAEMEANGQQIDAPHLQELSQRWEMEIAQEQRDLAGIFGTQISFTNDNQLRDLLYGQLRLPVVEYTKAGLAALTRGALLQLRPHHPGLEPLSKLREKFKAWSTYTHSLVMLQQSTGAVHTNFKVNGTKSGRLSSDSPNFQNIPSRNKELAPQIKQAWILPQGTSRIYADYSQVELRLLAWITGARTLSNAYVSGAYDAFVAGHITRQEYVRLRKLEPNRDVHGEQAINSFGADPSREDWKLLRNAAKIINFGVPYGMSHFGLMRNPALMFSETEARDYFDRYHRGTPEVNRTKFSVIDHMQRRCRRGQIPYVINWAGRKVHAPGLNSPDRREVKAEERSLFASLIQGSAAELTRYSIVAIYFAIRSGELPARLSSTIHDEIQLDCDTQHEQYVGRRAQEIMEDTFLGRFGGVPIRCDIERTRTNWAEKEEIEV